MTGNIFKRSSVQSNPAGVMTLLRDYPLPTDHYPLSQSLLLYSDNNDGDLAFRVWQSPHPAANEAPLLIAGQTVTNGIGGVSWNTGSTAHVYVQAVEPGSATLVYSFYGTGEAEGIVSRASMKLTAVSINLAGDTNRDGDIDENDESGKDAHTATRGILVTPPIRALADTGNDVSGLAKIQISTQPSISVPGLTLRLKKIYEPAGCTLHFLTPDGRKLPDIGANQFYSMSEWPSDTKTLYVMPQYARPLTQFINPVRFDLVLEVVDADGVVHGEDMISLKVAPMILPPENNTAQNVYTTAIEGIPGAVSVGADDAFAWAQDMVKFVKYQISDEHVGDMFVDLEHDGKGSFPDKLGTVAGCEGGIVWPVKMDGEGGNIMATPPLPDAPFGKILIGSTKPGYQDPLPYWRGQGVQPTVRIDTDWLWVGHLDEILMWVAPNKVLYADPWKAADLLHEEIAKDRHGESLWFGFDAAGTNQTIQQVVIAPLGGGYKLSTLPEPGLVNSTSSATIVFPAEIFAVGDVLRVGDEILNVTAANGVTVTVSRAHGGRPATAHAAGSKIYAYSDAIEENLPFKESERSVFDKIVLATNQLYQAINDRTVEFVSMPVLFDKKIGDNENTYSAATANVVNGMLSIGGVYCFPETGCTAFNEYVSTVLPGACKITGTWIGLHCQAGEIHCATTAQRDLDLSTPWWDKLEQWE
jgi:hypothetical protein